MKPVILNNLVLQARAEGRSVAWLRQTLLDIGTTEALAWSNRLWDSGKDYPILRKVK